MSIRLRDNARDGYSLVWDVPEGDAEKTVTVFAIGAKDDVHNKAPQKNTGTAGVFYPDGFTGTSTVEVRDEDGNVLYGPDEIEIA